MRLTCIFLILLSAFCFGQKESIVVAKFYNAVDKWVAFDEDSTYMVGFIYIDQQEGFTFRFDAMYLKTKDGLKKQPDKLENSIVITRLEANTRNVILLTDKQIKELGLPKNPDWLNFYKPKDENDNSYLLGIGYSYNHVGASHKAIEPLLKVYRKNPHFEGLEFELAYAYNALGNFDKAIDVLNKAIKNDPKNFWFYRELGFALLNQDKLEEAEKVYAKGIELSTKKEQQAEMAYNITYNYFKTKNKSKFEKWAKLTREYAEINSEIYRRIDYFEENWNK